MMEGQIKRRQKSKTEQYSKFDFSDKELQEDMEEEIQYIRSQSISQLDKEKLIYSTYEERKKKKKEKELRKDRQRYDRGAIASGIVHRREREANDEKHMDQREEGEIGEVTKLREPEPTEVALTLSELAEHIKPIVLTRSKLEDMLRLPRFEQLIKGCFVRCNCDKSSNNNYMLAEIVDTIQTSEYYTVVKVSTNIKIRLQLGSKDIQSLNMSVVSNQPLSSTLQIDRWMNRNRDKIPKLEDLKKKREMLEKGLEKQMSNEEIDSNIMRNIERIIKKSKEHTTVKEDVSSLLSFLLNKNHHLQKSIKDHEYMSHVEEVQSNNSFRRRKPEEQPVSKKSLTDLSKLQSQKSQVEQYIQTLKAIKKEQVDRKNEEKKEQQHTKKVEQIISSFDNSTREDTIAINIRQQIYRLSLSTESKKVRQHILSQHSSYPLQIDI